VRVIGSPLVAAWVAQVTFWVLLVYGRAFGELSIARVALFVGLWLLGAVLLSYAAYLPLRSMHSSWVAVLDIALVFIIFKGDVRLT